ncbi:MAG: hypothetical protein PHI12_07480 [Dehalococcoidales bacterium]|nr:hypothetical protein [Dehalococcoidales bacterium]
MLTLIDGPCKGTFRVKRAPKYLRAVIRQQLDGPVETDVLDQVEDKPEPMSWSMSTRYRGRPALSSWMGKEYMASMCLPATNTCPASTASSSGTTISGRNGANINLRGRVYDKAS